MIKPYKAVSADEAVKIVKSGNRIHISSVATTPRVLIEALVRRGEKGGLKNVSISHLHTEGPAPYAESRFEGIFNLESFFVGANCRKETQAGYADYIPCFLSETQRFYRSGTLKPNIVFMQVTPPDNHGYVSLGTSVDCTVAAIENADHVIAIVNKYLPHTLGDSQIPMDLIDIWVEHDEPILEAHFSEPDEIECAIGKHVAALIEDGSTIQMGIGSIPNAVLSQLGNHKDLGIHTEMFADGILPLVEKGIINGANKILDRGKLVSTFLNGSKKLFDFVDKNPMVLMKDVAYTNDPFIIRQNPKVIAINSAIQIDLTGQVCADSIGTKFFSGFGGQVDFIYGAGLSEGGKPIIAMPSITNKGVSKIAPILTSGAGVVTSRAHIRWVITEYGSVNLYGKTLQERARLLISIAHPDHRQELDKAAFERFGSHFHFISK